MKRPLKQRLIRIGAVTLLVVGLIYGYSYAFRNKTVNEAAPTSSQAAQAKKTPASASSSQPNTLSPTPPPTVPESPPPSTTTTAASGSFRSAPGERASGTVNLIKVDGHYFVRLESDTDIGASPDPIVTFGNGNRADLSINLGSLKGTKGSQNYEVPDSIDTSKYSQVIIYCRSFHVPIGYADLNR